MNQIWNPTIEDVLEAIELAKSRGVLPGQSYEKEFLEVMERKGKKPCGATEMNKQEIIEQYLEKDKTILDINIDKDGKQSCRIIKNNKPVND